MDWKTRVAKWVHEGKVWRADATATAAGVKAVPTTTAAWMFYNGEPKGGDVYVMLATFGIQTVAGAALSSWGIVNQVSDLATGTTAPTADLVTSLVCVNMKGNQGVYGGSAVISLADTVVDDRWAPIGNSTNTAVQSLSGTQIYVPLWPPVLVPPGSIYSLTSIVASTDEDIRLGNVWAEVDPAELAEMGLD